MYSIFHTSHCGSTLLSCLLSKSIPTLTEPKWSHEIKVIDNIKNKLKLVKNNHKQNILVKYPSFVCEIAPFVDGKKVFLYKNFEDHLCKMRAVHEGNDKDHAMFWCFRFANLIKSKDVLFLESNYFLSNQQEAAKKVCDWFGIDYVPVEIDFHVKQAGYNHKDEPIEI